MNLPDKMRDRADNDRLPENHELRDKADRFDDATHDFFLGKISTKTFFGYWARARKLWCSYSGGRLI
jgi:hypothetical protein